jgi:hypothetical protein
MTHPPSVPEGPSASDIEVLLADDHTLTRVSFRALFDARRQAQVGEEGR